MDRLKESGWQPGGFRDAIPGERMVTIRFLPKKKNRNGTVAELLITHDIKKEELNLKPFVLLFLKIDI